MNLTVWSPTFATFEECIEHFIEPAKSIIATDLGQKAADEWEESVLNELLTVPRDKPFRFRITSRQLVHLAADAI
jgi:hypothetical protein